MNAPEKKRLGILVGILAVVLVAALAYNALGDDDDGSSVASSATASSTAGAASRRSDVADSATTTVPPDPIGTIDVGLVRDPFAPPYSRPYTPPPDTTPTTVPGTGPVVTAPPDNSSPNPIEQNPAPANAVALLSITPENGVKHAQVRVGVTTYGVVEGQTFATSYKVLSLSETCGQFLYGDSPFTLCVGEQVLK